MDCGQVIAGFIAGILLSLLGLAGTVLPALPGGPLILFGILLYGLIGDFSRFTAPFLLGEAMLAASGFLIDYLATALGAKKAGGSRAAVWGAILGTFLGFLAGPWGILIGPILGAVTGELLTGKRLDEALRAGTGTLLGFLAGTIVKLVVAVIMIVWFLARIWPDVSPCLSSR